jgi:hypothetical protein
MKKSRKKTRKNRTNSADRQGIKKRMNESMKEQITMNMQYIPYTNYLRHACEVPGHSTAIIIASLQKCVE